MRCGYPLDQKQVENEVRDKIYKAVSDLIEAAELVPWHEPAGRLRKKIEAEVAHAVAKSKGFGGNERRIFTEKCENYEGKQFVVVGKRVVQTGVYQPGSSYGYAEYDADPPALTQQKTHILLRLASLPRSPNTLYVNRFEIQAEYVRHLSDEEN